MLSANRGDTWSTSVRFPRQPQGRCQPMSHNPARYTRKHVEIHATPIKLMFRRAVIRQKKAIRSSVCPTSTSTNRDGMPKRGSAVSSARTGPVALMTLAKPVRARTPPPDQRNLDSSCRWFPFRMSRVVFPCIKKRPQLASTSNHKARLPRPHAQPQTDRVAKHQHLGPLPRLPRRRSKGVLARACPRRHRSISARLFSYSGGNITG